MDLCNEHSIAWGPLILKPDQNRFVKQLVGTSGQYLKNRDCPSKTGLDGQSVQDDNNQACIHN